MKKIISVLLVAVLLLGFAACGKSDPNAPDDPKDVPDCGTVTVFMDGEKVSELSYEDFKKKADSKSFDDKYYYGAVLSEIVKDADFDTVKAAFTKSTDGYAAYTESPADLFVAAFAANDEKVYEAITDKEGNGCFTAMDGDNKIKCISEIYLLSNPADFSVEVTKNGEPYKTVTIADFMGAKPDYKELSHMYNAGADIFEGTFLALDTETMLNTIGITYSEGNKLEIYKPDGTMNTELSNDPDAEKSVWKVYYFVLIDGRDHSDIIGSDLGLSCISDGTGMRWLVSDISKINWVTEEPAE